MKKIFLHFLKDIPLILISILLAFLIWVFATVSSDPTEEGRFPQTVTIETVGLSDDMIITSGMPYTVSINMRAPNSIWRRISLERIQGKAVIDVTGLEAGTHQVPINLQIGISPVQVISFSPSTATITIEKFETREFPLEVDETGDILECGITINAQPPGKNVQNMMILSGGERALTAICLLFAIQNLKPSPFCLLDEIEAALDDSNVSRFAKYLNKLTKNTQFIVITHRRGTMSAADRLYGITMQEKGVSALVSVNLIEEDLE